MEKQAPKLTERHLGLIAPDKNAIPDFSSCFYVNEHLLKEAFTQWYTKSHTIKHPNIENQKNLLLGKKIAIAKDKVCCFIYQANIDWLNEQGAKIVYFSILKGEEVPYKTDAIWLPRGYPELYTQPLSVSTSWKSLNHFIHANKPVLAECGGSMLLGSQLIDKEGKAWSMAKTLTYHSKMQPKLASLGYREDISGIRGHEFHYSTREGSEAYPFCFNCKRGDRGIRYKNVHLSYIHWYFSSASIVAAGWFTNS